MAIIIKSIKRDHGLVDAKGRAIGGEAILKKLEADEIDPVAAGYSWYYSTADKKAPGEYKLFVYATRNGVGYGASPRGTFYKTAEAALVAAEKALVAQGKRYARTFPAATEVVS